MIFILIYQFVKCLESSRLFHRSALNDAKLSNLTLDKTHGSDYIFINEQEGFTMQTKQILIEFGSNTAKIFSPDENGSRGKTLVFPLRLIGGLDAQNSLTQDKIDKMIDLIEDTKARHPQAECHLIATQALRSAANKAEIIRQIRLKTGLNLQILSAQDEARAAFLGIMTVSHIVGNMLSFDIGGASTELIFGKNGKLEHWQSIPLGAVNLTQNRNTDSSFKKELQRHIPQDMIRQLIPADTDNFCLVGCGGSVNTALSIALAHHTQSLGEPDRQALSLTEINRQIKLMEALSTNEIAAIPGMDPTRADIMPAALSIIRHILEISGKDNFLISAGGVRQGYFLL